MGFYSGVLKTLLESFTCVDVITWSGDHPERPSQRGFPGTYILSLTLCLLINNDFSGFSNFLILLKIYIYFTNPLWISYFHEGILDYIHPSLLLVYFSPLPKFAFTFAVVVITHQGQCMLLMYSPMRGHPQEHSGLSTLILPPKKSGSSLNSEPNKPTPPNKKQNRTQASFIFLNPKHDVYTNTLKGKGGFRNHRTGLFSLL